MWHPREKHGIYLEHTEGHDKWWALIPTGRGTWEAWYGGRGRIHPKSTEYNSVEAQKKFVEKVAKGYEERGAVEKYSDLVLIQDTIKRLGTDGYKAFKKSIKGKMEKKKREPTMPAFDFLAELRKI